MKSRNDLWRVSMSGSPSQKITLSSSPTQLLVGKLTRLPFHSGYATAPKTCELDPAPTFLVQELIDDFLYFLTVLSNSLLREEYLPVSQKPSIILPDLKHDGLDQCDPANYRPHCKCNSLSKFLEHIVASQLIAYLDANESITSVRRNDSREALLLQIVCVRLL